jgi:hypothetical protein
MRVESRSIPRRAVLLGLGMGLNGRRASETLSGQAAVGLRFPRAELQLTLSFPSLALLGQVRLNLLTGQTFWLIPFLSAGAAISYNNGTDHGTAASVVGGGGLRVGPFRSFAPSLWNRLYASVEVLVSYVFSQPTPPGRSEVEELAVPVLVSVGMELWP